MNIRPADIRDLAALSRIEASCFDAERYPRELVEEMLAQEEFFTFLAEEGGVLGAVIVRCPGKEAQLVSVAVLPAFRESGVASALLERAEGAARERGAEEMVLQVSVVNVAAMNLYLRRGYVLEGIVGSYYGPRRDAYLMRRRL